MNDKYEKAFRALDAAKGRLKDAERMLEKDPQNQLKKAFVASAKHDLENAQEEVRKYLEE